MIALLDSPPAVRPRPNLLLHCGARAVPREEVITIPTPECTRTWTPIPHIELLSQVECTLASIGLALGVQAHSLSHNQARYFGIMEIQRPGIEAGYCWVLGLRNSHDKTFPPAITAGASGLVCDNLSFSGEVKLARKHTRFIARDLPQLVQSAVGKLMERWHHQDLRLAAHRQAALSDRAAHDLVIRAFDVGVLHQPPRSTSSARVATTAASTIRKSRRLEPVQQFTEALKGNLLELPRRTEALHGLLDSFANLQN